MDKKEELEFEELVNNIINGAPMSLETLDYIVVQTARQLYEKADDDKKEES